MKARALALGMALMVWGCKTSYQREGDLPGNLNLDTSAAVYVLAPPDFTAGFQSYPASGHLAGLVLKNILGLHFKNVTLSEGAEPFTNHLARAQSLGCAYFFRPVLEAWEERDTHNSGLRDRVSVRVTLLALPAVTPLNEVVLMAQSRWFGASDEDVADDLLVGLYNGYVRALLGDAPPNKPPGPPETVKFPRLYDDF